MDGNTSLCWCHHCKRWNTDSWRHDVLLVLNLKYNSYASCISMTEETHPCVGNWMGSHKMDGNTSLCWCLHCTRRNYVYFEGMLCCRCWIWSKTAMHRVSPWLYKLIRVLVTEWGLTRWMETLHYADVIIKHDEYCDPRRHDVLLCWIWSKTAMHRVSPLLFELH